MKCTFNLYCALLPLVFTLAQPLRELPYALFTSSVESPFVSSGAVPAIELAEDEILKDPSLLPGYVLNHTSVEDTLVR